MLTSKKYRLQTRSKSHCDMSRWFSCVKGVDLPGLWLHNITITRRRGFVKAYCACGAQSRRLTSDEDAQAWGRTHMQIKEKKGTGAPVGRT